MTRTIKRGLHLAALLIVGAIALTGSRASAGLGTPVSACTTLAANTSYYLTQNISGVSGDCFVVQEGTSLDMKGHAIKSSNQSGWGISDECDSAPNVVILNGTITNFETGIVMCGSQSYNLSVDSVNINKSNGDGIQSSWCCNTITNVKATGNNGYGIRIFEGFNTFANDNVSGNDEGLLATQGGNLAFGITANNNSDGPGIDLEGCCNKLQASTANQNAGHGIFMDGDDEIVESSTANGNVLDGIDVFEPCCAALVDHATANLNGEDGIAINGHANVVTNNVASQNGGTGIDLGDVQNDVFRNTTLGNGSFGVEVVCGSGVGLLQSHNNSCTDLCESSGTCSNFNNNASNVGCGC